MLDILTANPLLLLFLVSALGYVLGRIRVKGSSLGVAAVLFVGLAAGALAPGLSLPPVIFELGLIIFVYTLGLTSGPGFFSLAQRAGDNPSCCCDPGCGGLTVAVAAAEARCGVFRRSLTNTPRWRLLRRLATAPPDQRAPQTLPRGHLPSSEGVLA